MAEICEKHNVYKSICECWNKTKKKHSTCKHIFKFTKNDKGNLKYDGISCGGI